MHVLKRSLLLLGVTALTLTACKDDDPVAVDTIAVTSVTVSPANGVTLADGQESQVSATVATNGGTGTIDLGVTWSSSNSSIASISASGVVRGESPGNTTVTAASNANPNIKASIGVEVTGPATAPDALLTFTVTPNNVAIVANGGEASISTTTTVSPGATAPTFTHGSNSARCTVTATGADPTITTVGPGAGSCVITSTAMSTGAGLVSNSIPQAVAVTITEAPPALVSLSVVPSTVNLAPGGSQDLTVTAVLSAGASVTYVNSSANEAVATVTQGSSPTINAVGNGTTEVTIQASGTGGVNTPNVITATVQVNVAAASVSISAVEAGGLPVNLSGVLGQIEVILNISSGNQTISSVTVELGPPGTSCDDAAYVVAQSQNFGINGAPEAPVSLSVETQEFDASFTPKWINGANCLRARISPVAGPQPNASNTYQFTLVNPDVVYFNASVGTTADALGLNHIGNSATGPGGLWWRDGFTFRAHPVLYSGVSNVTSITYTSSPCGSEDGVAPTFSATFSCSGESTSAQSISNAVTIAYVATYTLTVSPTGFMTAASPGFEPGNPVYSAVSTREDNVAPTIVAGTVAFNDDFDEQWVNASYAFLGDFTITDPSGVGVDAATRLVKVFTGTCSGATVVTGADLAETLISVTPDGHRVCASAADLLGNTNAGSGASNFFGVDKGVPSVRLAGSTAATPAIVGTPASVSTTANTTIYGDGAPVAVMPATDVWGLEGIDTRSGFNQNGLTIYPAVQSLTRLAPTGATSCGLFTSPLSVVLTDNFVRTPVLVALDCVLGIGYYDYSGHVVDRAGNSSSTITRNFAQDHLAAPTLSSIGLAAAFYTVGAQGDFFLFGSDDLEIIEGDVSVSYPNDKLVVATLEGITYSLANIGGAARWDATLNTLVAGQTISVASLLGRIDFTCTGAGTPYASCAGADAVATVAAEFNNVAATDDGQNPDSVRAVAYDVASNVSNAVATAILAAQTNDVAQQWVGADLLSWRILSTAGPITAEHMASTSITAVYFDVVHLARADAGGTELRICGNFGAPELTDNGVNRFWTYSMTTPSSGTCATGGLWYVIGLKNGAALITQGM